MAFVGYCERHGNYIDSCIKCYEEAWLHSLTQLIKSGIDPEEALKQILDEKLKQDRKLESEKLSRKANKELKEMMRAHWITNNLPPELRDDITY